MSCPRRVVSALLVFGSLGAGHPQAGPPGPETRPRLQASGRSLEAGSKSQDILGYRLGEERRYILGPPDALVPGVYARWPIRLEAIDGTEPDEAYVFRLEHERFQSRRGVSRFTEVIVRATTRLTVNRQGFPLVLQSSRELRTPDGHDWVSERSQQWDYADGRYERRTKSRDRARPEFDEFQSTIRVPATSYVDFEARHGLFLFNPSGLACMGLARRRQRFPCRFSIDEGDPAFTNPGLLGFALARGAPASAAGGAEWEVLALRPNSGARFRSTTILRAEITSLEIAERTMPALRFDVEGLAGAAFVDPADGKVLLVEIDKDNETMRERWIRLLLPFEY